MSDREASPIFGFVLALTLTIIMTAIMTEYVFGLGPVFNGPDCNGHAIGNNHVVEYGVDGVIITLEQDLNADGLCSK